MRTSPLHVDAVITDLAAGRHGVVTRRQLLAAGVGPGVVDRRLARGLLRRVHRGVYRVGPVVSPLAREMAAVLACGPAAVLSHRSAAVLWELLPGSSRPRIPEVVDRRGDPRRPGIRVRRIRTLREEDVTTRDGIPVTTPVRPLLDLAADGGRREVERAFAEALARHLAHREGIRTLLAGHHGRAGTRPLRALLEGGTAPLTRSEAEERMLALIREACLEEPETNARVEVATESYEVDFLWRGKGLVVEVDGFAFHSSRRAFHGDRRRDGRLTAAGLRVVRVTWDQLAGEPMAVVALLAAALAMVG